RLVHAPGGAVVPQMTGGTGQDRVAAAWVDEDLRDVLGVIQSDVGPALAAIDRLVDAVADRHAVADPAFAGAGPDDLRVRGIDRDGADGLDTLLIEDRPECRSAVDRFPHASARRSHDHGQPAVVVDGGDGGDAAAHRGRAD